MSRFTLAYNDFISHLQQLVYQPAARRTAVTSMSLGFTIVELLIVIVIIGILAAIVIVAFTGIQNRAHDAAVENDLVQIGKRLELYKLDPNLSPSAQYPSNEAELTSANLKATKNSYLVRNNLYYCRSNDGLHYAIGAYSKSGSRYWLKDGSKIKTTDSISGASTCTELDPYPHPTAQNAYGLYDTTGWRAWVQ